MSKAWYMTLQKLLTHNFDLFDFVPDTKYVILYIDSGSYQFAGTENINSDQGWEFGDFIDDKKLISWFKNNAKVFYYE